MDWLRGDKGEDKGLDSWRWDPGAMATKAAWEGELAAKRGEPDVAEKWADVAADWRRKAGGSR